MASNNDSYAEEWLQFEQMTGGRFNLSGDVSSIRAQFLGLFDNMKSMLPPHSQAVKSEDLTISESGVPIRVYTPAKESTAARSIGLFIHSGGWITGGIECEDHLCRQYAEQADTVLVSVEYRLAPEYPFPNGLDDCVAAYKWMVENASIYNASAAAAYLVGGSAGGSLSVSTALRIMSEPQVQQPAAILGSCLVCCEPSVLPDKYKGDWHPEHYEGTAFLDRPAMNTCYKAYGAAADDKLFSTLLHPDIGKLPPTYLFGGNRDPTFDETFILNKELKEKRVKTDLKVYDGYPHYFFIVPMLKASQQHLSDVTERIRSLAPSS